MNVTEWKRTTRNLTHAKEIEWEQQWVKCKFSPLCGKSRYVRLRREKEVNAWV